MIYLDNSSTTFVKPKEVLRYITLAATRFTANPGRSGHYESIQAAMEVEKVRAKLKDILNLESESNVIFTSSCSMALNIAILGSAKQGGHVVCTENDHNSVLRPLEHLRQIGKIDYTVAYQSSIGCLKCEDIEKCLRPETYMVICNHMSNVNGDTAEINKIGKMCKEKGLLFLLGYLGGGRKNQRASDA